jgi:sucrose-6-phosphate hydrolase SacC (GH32 family)
MKKVARATKYIARTVYDEQMPASVIGWQNVMTVARQISLSDSAILKVQSSPQLLH